MKNFLIAAMSIVMVLTAAIVAVTIVSCKNSVVEEKAQPTTAAATTEQPTQKPKKQPSSVSVGTPMLTIGVGENADLQARYDGSEPAEGAVYASNRTGVVTIDEAAGRITGAAEGGTVVTVKSGNNKTANCFVTVKKAPTKVNFPVDKLNMLAGEQTTLTLIPAEGEGFSSVTLTSSDSGVVSVASNGLLTAGKAGSATVTCTTFNGQKATCTVTVLDNSGVTDRQTAVDAPLLREPGWQFPSVQTVPANSSTSLLRWALPSCRMEGSAAGSSPSMTVTQACTSASLRETPSALATRTTSRMAAIMVSRISPGCCSSA